MYTKDAIRFSLNLAEEAVLKSLATIDDAPLTFPTGKGGCDSLPRRVSSAVPEP